MANNLPIQDLLERIKENWGDAATPETSIIFGVLRFSELIRQKTDYALSEFDLTHAAFEVLVALRAQPAPRQLTPTELSRSVLLSSGGITKVLIQLENRGLIKRVPNPVDGRSKIVRLTNAGSQLVESAMTAVMEQDRKHFASYANASEISDLSDTILQMMARVEST